MTANKGVNVQNEIIGPIGTTLLMPNFLLLITLFFKTMMIIIHLYAVVVLGR